MIDTHCHLDVAAYDPDREAVWQRAREQGVRAVIVPAVEPATWAQTRAIARPGERFVAFGIHPQVLPDLDDEAVDRGLADLERVAREAGAVAIGECGFDGGIDLARAPMERQCRVVAAHIEVARRLDLPVILHVLRAHGDATAFFRGVRLPRAGGVVHSYSGSVELLRDYLDAGFHISFGGGVTRPNARRPVLAAKAVPSDRLLIETDGPDQLPSDAETDPIYGRRCEPRHVALVATRLAEIRGIPVSELVRSSSGNAIALFRLGDLGPPRTA